MKLDADYPATFDIDVSSLMAMVTVHRLEEIGHAPLNRSRAGSSTGIHRTSSAAFGLNDLFISVGANEWFLTNGFIARSELCLCKVGRACNILSHRDNDESLGFFQSWGFKAALAQAF